MKHYWIENATRYERIKARGPSYWGDGYSQDDLENFSSRPFLEDVLLRLQPLPSNPSVLEIGAGPGPVACYLAERGFRVHGLELIPWAVNRAREAARAKNMEIEFEVADVCEYPLEGRRYDLVIDSFCLQNIVYDSDRSKVFRVVKARLSPAGVYLISTAMYNPEFEPLDETVTDEAGKVYYVYRGGLLDRESEVFYRKIGVDEDREEFDDVLALGNEYYMTFRRYRNPDTLRAELTEQGFCVLYQTGELGENVVCALPGSPVSVIEPNAA